MHTQTDLIVLGAGAGGLAAAVTAAAQGLRVIVLEKADVVGGTTAWSGGWIWAPGNALGAALDPQAEQARTYLQAVCGAHLCADRVDAFLAAAPQMVDFFHTQTALQFDGGFAIPDTYGHQPGAGMGGRSVIARPFDARALGASIGLLRPPVRETTFFGMTIQAGPDLRAFMTMTRSPRALAYASGRVVRHIRDLALYRRGMDLRNGAALAGRLLRSALDLGVQVQTGVQVQHLTQVQTRGQVDGVRLTDGTQIFARAVVLACGGYGHAPDVDVTEATGAAPAQSLSVPTARGDGLALAQAVGAALDMKVAQNRALCPVSSVCWPDGRDALFPHIIDRGKPGVIGVLQSGQRFCNEGLGYHDYVEAMLRAVPRGQPAQSWLICDYRFLRRYGLGVVRPQPVPWRQWVKRGYLHRGRNLHALAQSCGIDPDGLAQTIARFNADAARGEDSEFGRGTTAYMRLQGDPQHAPNPNLAPIAKPPFFAVKVVPGSFSTFAGIATDPQARVLREDGSVIDGLWSAGSDAASVFGGFYPAGGINLGPALTFGFVAGRDVAEQIRTHRSEGPG
ncbi:FAD-binding dehydrogenase [Thioclava sp. SK-1]|uniref:FAD-dependent oxidoreductase n=1 Tax=Thioclava sp. SK-1 TaxID=1889770 RepID=UPI00082578F8|nr:FAD-dependent oxidoreductase [Thioclava sp. SK-1]OCX67365.1 FAD-binding dehydrogenase [Thioclava sp. SK-1]